MMFGMNMVVESEQMTLSLGPISKFDIPVIAGGFSSLRVHMWTNQLYAQVVENEEEWYDKTRKSQDSCVWGITPEGSDILVGVTGIHKIDQFGFCTTGIIIWDPEWWGKGLATLAHLARTLFAADYLNRSHINSMVSLKNIASQKALERVGYSVWGTEPLTVFRQGKWVGVNHLKWINPSKVNQLFPDGLPGEFKKGVAKATEALELARRTVSFP